MSRNTIRPTNVRASVGSRASGSASSAIVSVPPLFRAGGAEVWAEALTPTRSVIAATAPVTARRRVSLILVVPLLMTAIARQETGAQQKRHKCRLDPSFRQMDPRG